MDYSKASDFEINKCLAGLLGLTLLDDQYPDIQSCVLVLNDKIEIEYETSMDYCNSWADMGPVITSNQISIYSFITFWRCSSLLVKDIGSYVDHTNPLRAAAIVAIQVLEAKQ